MVIMTIFLLIVGVLMVADLLRMVREFNSGESPICEETKKVFNAYGESLKDYNEKLDDIIEKLKPIVEYYKTRDNGEDEQNGSEC
jgi:hypothetical protein